MQSYKTVQKRQANHVLHLVMTIITFGMWIPVWIIASMMGRKEVTRQQVMPAPYWQQQRPPGVQQQRPYSQH